MSETIGRTEIALQCLYAILLLWIPAFVPIFLYGGITPRCNISLYHAPDKGYAIVGTGTTEE